MLGELLAARYQVIEVLGSGGFGHTYIAEDTHRPGNPRCVLKHLTFVSPNPKVIQQVRRLFQAEAETLEQLGQHDQIPRLLAYFEINQQFYLVQEFIDGHPLSEELKEGSPQPEERVISLLEDVLHVLDFVHAQGVIHRDIKPENLIRRKQDHKLVLIDFGAVKTIGNTAIESSGETTLSVPIYTSGYGASEQCMGRPRYNSDIYSLGIVAIQALTGLRPTQLPQDSNTCEVIWRDRVPQVNERLAAVLDQMVRYHCNHRYQTAAAVLEALAGVTTQRHTAISQNTLITHFSLVTPQDPLRSGSRQSVNGGQQPQQRNDRAGHARSGNSWKWWTVVGVSLVALTTAMLMRHWLSVSPSDSTPSTADISPILISNRISMGEKLLSPLQSDPDKQQGAVYLAAGNYAQAVMSLEAARKKNPGDPESLIYLNNARIGNAKSLTIAAAVPLSNSYSTALDILRGVGQAQTQVNRAGGIQGVKLRVAIADDDNDPDTGQQLAKTFVADPTILGVVGHSISDTTLAAAEVYQAGQLVMVSPLSSAVKLSSIGKYIFRTMPSDSLTAKALATYMLSRLKQKKAIVFFNSGSAYSQSLKTEFQKALFYNNVELLGEIDLSRPDFDAFNSVSQAQAKGVQVIVLAPDFTTSDRAIQVVQVNNQRLKLLSGEAFYTSRILTVAGEDAVGMVLAVPTEVSRSPFAQQFSQLWGESNPANWRSALAYDAAQSLIAGLRLQPTRDGVQRALAQPNFAADGATAKVRFLPTGDRQSDVRLVKVAPVTVGKQTRYSFQLLP